jgi:DNA excision repair protein ERCC-6
MISFLAGLHYTGLLDKPIVVVAPGAVLGQWASEFHTWWPALRVAILHKSGSGMLLSRDGQIDSQDDEPHRPTKDGMFAAKKIVERVFRHGHVLITTYEGLNTYGDLLVEKGAYYEW